jgi:hypothetical protein
METKIGTVFKVDVAGDELPACNYVNKTPLNPDDDVEKLYAAMENVYRMVREYFKEHSWIEPNLPSMCLGDGDVRMLKVFGKTLSEMNDAEIAALPDEIMDEILMYVEMSLSHEEEVNGKMDFIDIWGFDRRFHPLVRPYQALNLRRSTNLMVGHVMEQSGRDVWVQGEKKLWFVDPDTYLRSCTNWASKTFIPMLRPTVMKLLARRFERSFGR